jgi:hypothetical protein
VRVIVPVGEGEQSSTAEADLARFTAELEPVLERYVPRDGRRPLT